MTEIFIFKCLTECSKYVVRVRRREFPLAALKVEMAVRVKMLVVVWRGWK